MQKMCNCGKDMSFGLRKVIYSSKIEIEHVPIFSCDACLASEIYSAVKNDLSYLISQLDESPNIQVISFNEYNEFAHLILLLSDQDQLDTPVEEIIEDRINELLDMLLLAQSLKDEQWMKDIEYRLQQITEQTVKMYDVS